LGGGSQASAKPSSCETKLPLNTALRATAFMHTRVAWVLFLALLRHPFIKNSKEPDVRRAQCMRMRKQVLSGSISRKRSSPQRI